MELEDNPELIEKYIDAHRRIWPEIPAGIRQVGIERMDIYRLGTRLVMITEMADGIDRDEAMARLATLPRQAEWEAYVGRFQRCKAGATSADKWQLMEQYFSL